MAAPTRNPTGVGFTILAGTTGTTNGFATTVGRLIILQVLQDGTAADVTLTDTNNTVNALDGTANTMTPLPGNPYNVGPTPSAKQFIWVGRAAATTVTMDLASSGGDDMYCAISSFQDVNTGATLADVIENGTAGNANNETGATTTVTDTAVVTLGADRLALNMIAVNDDNQADFATAFTGMSGGTWTRHYNQGSSTGTDGAAICFMADMASAGTINGGSLTMAAADPWGNVGFALIGTTAGGPATHQGSVTAPFTFDSTEVGRLNPAKASVTAPFTMEPSIAGFARRYGAITTPVTWDAAVAGVLKKFGALTTPFTFDAALLTLTTRYGTVTAPFTWDATESARVTMRSSVTAPWTWTVDSAGFARRFGASDNPYVFGISVDGQVTTGAETIFGALANDLVWTATTNGIRIRYSAVDLPISWTATEAARLTARSSITAPFTWTATEAARLLARSSVTSPFVWDSATTGKRTAYGALAQAYTFTISTGQRVTMRAALAEAYLFAVATGQRVTMRSALAEAFVFGIATGQRLTARASVGEAYLWDVYVNGELAGGIKTGSVTSPFTWTATTNGVRRTYGASDNPVTFGAATAGYTKLYGAVTLPLTFERVVNGIRIRYGSLTLPIVWDSSTSGATSGVITGAVTSPFTFEVASGTRLTARGTVALDLTFDTATLARLKLLAALDVPLALAVDTTGIRVVAGATATELVWLASVSGIADVTLLEAIFTGRVGNGWNGGVETSQGRIGDTVAGVAFQEDEVVTGRIA